MFARSMDQGRGVTAGDGVTDHSCPKSEPPGARVLARSLASVFFLGGGQLVKGRLQTLLRYVGHPMADDGRSRAADFVAILDPQANATSIMWRHGQNRIWPHLDLSTLLGCGGEGVMPPFNPNSSASNCAAPAPANQYRSPPDESFDGREPRYRWSVSGLASKRDHVRTACPGRDLWSGATQGTRPWPAAGLADRLRPKNRFPEFGASILRTESMPARRWPSPAST